MNLTSGGYAATVAPLGATLQRLTHDGDDLVVPVGPDTPSGTYRGATLAPWPNRVDGGRYRFDGVDHQLPVNEPARGHALHGFTAGLEWAVAEQSESAVVLRLDLPPQPGYPFSLLLEMAYTLSDDGMRIALSAHNTGKGSAPYGCSIHPYLTCGTPRVDGAVLTLPAATRLEVDDGLIPVGSAPVEAIGCDFRDGDAIGTRLIDHAFTDLDVAADGTATADVTRPSGGGVRMRWGPWARWVQVHTADRPEPVADRVGLALEPMSCAPDAFNSGAGLVVLAPGEEHAAWWTISAC